MCLSFNSLETNKPIPSISGNAEYLITGQDDCFIYFKRVRTRTEEKIKKSKLEEIKKLKEAGKNINTKSIKNIVSGQQSPALAILKELRII